MVDMARAVEFDRWLDDEFVELNTFLEEAYFAARKEVVRGDADLDARKEAILFDGAKLAAAIVDAGDLPADPVARYQLLGSVGATRSTRATPTCSHRPGPWRRNWRRR
jgi:hypothetical protein